MGKKSKFTKSETDVIDKYIPLGPSSHSIEEEREEVLRRRIPIGPSNLTYEEQKRRALNSMIPMGPVKHPKTKQKDIEDIGDLLRKNEEWRNKSLIKKLDSLEKNVEGNSEQYNSLIKGEIMTPILNVLPRYIDIEKWNYKDRELKIIFHKPEYLKGLSGKVIYETSEPMFESDYDQLLRNYPCVRKVISDIEKIGIKVVYDRKDGIIRTSA